MGEIKRVAVIGGGLIGQSWAALMLAQGFEVTVQDIAAGVEARVTAAVVRAWPDLVRLGLAAGTVPWDRLEFEAGIGAACEGADFVQECGPDRLILFARAVTTPDEKLDWVRLGDATPEMADMRTMVIVGSSATRRIEGTRFVYTPRSAS